MVSHTVWGGAEDDGAMVGDPSVVFEQAVAAYAHGRFAVVISHLRSLERAAAVGHAVVDARHAALRGALAVRAQNWTECCDWYVQSLTFSLPGARVCQLTLSCFHEDCTDHAGDLCGQCDRWFCPDHGAVCEDGAARCGPCLDVALHNLVQGAILSDSVQTAVETLTLWARTANWATAKALLACLAPEDAADFGEQSDVLDSFAPDRRGALLTYRASATLGNTDLERACVPEPGASELPLSATYALLSPWEARGLSRAGRHTEAWRVRYEDWLAKPFDTTVAHALALTALRVCTHDTEADDRIREEAARQAIACWAMVLHSTSYWQDLERHSGRSLASEERKAASDALTERIRQALRDDDRTAERPTVESLELAWEVELTVAQSLPDVMTDVLTPLGSGYDFSFGPSFLDLLSSVGGPWKVLVADIHSAVSDATLRGDETGVRLEGLLSPEGRYLMLLDSGRFDDVIVALETAPTARQGPQEDTESLQGPRRILGAALFARARAHMEARRWSAAVRDFEDAAATGASLTDHEEEIGLAGVNAGFALSHNRSKVDWQAYVGLLERVVIMAPHHEDLKRNLAVGCVRLGEQAQQRDAHDEARVRFTRAYELDPSNKLTVAALNAAETRSAERLLEKDPFSGLLPAIATLRSVLDRDETFQLARRALADALYEQALDTALNGDRADVLRLMKEAYRLSYPDSHHWVSGRGSKYDIASGLYGRASRYGELDEDDLRDTLAILTVARGYEVLPTISDTLVSVLADLVKLESTYENYDEAIALVRRCPRDVEDRSRLDTAVAEAYARRARQHLENGDTLAARSDTRSAHKYASAHQLSLFQVDEANQLW